MPSCSFCASCRNEKRDCGLFSGKGEGLPALLEADESFSGEGMVSHHSLMHSGTHTCALAFPFRYNMQPKRLLPPVAAVNRHWPPWSGGSGWSPSFMSFVFSPCMLELKITTLYLGLD